MEERQGQAPARGSGPSCWQTDEHGNVYRVLTPSEQAKVISARAQRETSGLTVVTSAGDTARGAQNGSAPAPGTVDPGIGPQQLRCA